MPKASRLSDLVRTSIRSASKTGFAPWYARLPPELQIELLEELHNFYSGLWPTASKNGFATVIAESVEKLGYERPGIQAVLGWMRKHAAK